ncbi:MAG: protein phosphatase 2C domain-containing protein [Bacteroidota bacterium]
MKEDIDFTKGVMAVARATNKAVNQDFGLVINHSSLPLSGVAVADGLGSFYRAEVASRVACETMERLILEKDDFPICYQELFQAAEQGLIQRVEENKVWLEEMPDASQAFGTSLICAVELEKTIELAYLGNGAIFHLRGNFNDFPSSRLLPWNSVNYLNPHTIDQNGKEAMYKLIAYCGMQQHPTQLSISKDLNHYGDIIMICTDGIYSADQLAIGKSSDGKYWVSGEESMKHFYQSMNTFFEQEELTSDRLALCLEEYLEKLKTADLMEDDCTIGVVITTPTLAYQQKRKKKKEESDTWEFSLD